MSRAPFAEVAFVLPLRQTFTYSVPDGLLATARPGAHVLAPFRGKPRRGFVVERVTETQLERTVAITAVLEAEAISTHLLALARWIAGYYVAPLGEVLGAALPGGLEGFAASRARRGAVEDPVLQLAMPERVVLTFSINNSVFRYGDFLNEQAFELDGELLHEQGLKSE